MNCVTVAQFHLKKSYDKDKTSIETKKKTVR